MKTTKSEGDITGKRVVYKLQVPKANKWRVAKVIGYSSDEKMVLTDREKTYMSIGPRRVTVCNDRWDSYKIAALLVEEVIVGGNVWTSMRTMPLEIEMEDGIAFRLEASDMEAGWIVLIDDELIEIDLTVDARGWRALPAKLRALSA